MAKDKIPTINQDLLLKELLSVEPQIPDTALKPTLEPKDINEHVSDFSTIRQGSSTNSLTKMRVKDAAIDIATGTARVTDGNMILSIPNYDQLMGIRTSTHQLLDALTIKLTETGAKSPEVIVSLTEYMERRGLQDRKEARKQVEADLKTLRQSFISWEEKRGNKIETLQEVNLADSWGWVDKKRTSFVYRFGQTFYNALLGYTVMPYPAQLQTLNPKRNPNSYYFLRKISEHKNMNVGKRNEDLITIKTLLACSPYLPTASDVMRGNRNLTDRIIAPFERDMDILDETLTWEYCHSNGKPLTDEENTSFSYELFENLLVHITWRKYPDQTARLERKAERVAIAKRPRTTKNTK